MVPWPLTMALGAIEAEVWSTTPFRALGLLQPTSGGQTRFEIHTPSTIASSALDAAELQPGGAVDRVLALWRLGAPLRAPFVSTDGVLFGALPADAAEPGDVQTLAAFAQRIEAISRKGEPIAVREERLARVDALAGALDALSRALDIRSVFGQLSAIARRVLPHDSAVVLTITDDRRRVGVLALSAPEGWTLPDEAENPYPQAMTEGWDFAIHRDLTAHPFERNAPPARLGLRSSLRLPIRLDGRVRSALDFSSLEPNRYVVSDLPIARRIADYVTLVLSHQRLSDEAREAAAVHERAASLDVLDGLLKTLTGVLDVRDVFDRISTISHKVMTHDAMSISIPSDECRRWTIHVATGALSHLQTPFEMDAPTPRLLDSHWDFELVEDMTAQAKYDGTPSVRAGLRNLLSIPVWVEGRLRATVNFYSRTPGHLTTDDVLVGRRIADHIALALSHQRLAEEARRNVELRARADNLELLDELLATVTDSAELTDVFDRVSTLAKRVLAHDMLVVAVLLPDGVRAKVYARTASPRDLPDVVEIPPEFVGNNTWEYDLIDDAQTHPERRNLLAAKAGYRSALRVPIRFDGTFAASLSFLALEPFAYKQADVQVARRVADRITLALMRERGAEASKRADEASARASRLESRVRELTDELDARTGYRRVVGESPSWRQVLTQATQVADTDTTVLLLGESGTGKEVIARFLHRASARSTGPFIALNCAALPEQLLEAELFGYERGAFTGATQSKPGQLEQAGGGTLFLDEVGEMSPQVQAKFLRVLQEREFHRLGGTRVLRTDARIVAATNRDLQLAIAREQFREDLFYRLNVFAISLPPLRDRRDDILPLSEAFLADIARGLGRPPGGISKDARQLLVDYHWPGNVRELRNILERAAILCDGGLITAEHLTLDVVSRSAPSPAALAVAAASTTAAPPATTDLNTMERGMIEQALQNTRFNKSQAAKALGLTRAQLYVRMKRHGLE